MNIFKFKFTKIIVILMILALLLAILGFSLNIIRLTDLIKQGGRVYSYISTAIMLIMTTALAFIIVSVMICANYKLTDKTLTVRLGVIRTVIATKDIYRITRFKKTDKLVIYFGEDKYSVIVIKNDLYDGFIQALIKSNPKIAYDISSDEDEKPA